MKALILAAGLGSRLLGHTIDKPKALVPVAGKPIIDYQIEALMQSGIKDINIVVGYLGDKIVKHLETFEKRGCRFSYRFNKEYETSNSSYSFWLARELIKDAPYIHLNCDILFSGKILERLVLSEYKDIIVLDNDIELADNMEQVRLDGDRIVEMRNIRFPGASGKAVGVAKFSQQTVHWLLKRTDQYIKSDDKNQNYYGIIREAVNHLDIRVMPTEGFLLEINSVNDLEKANQKLSKDHVK